MPRRYATYSPEDGFTWMNQLSTFGAMILALSMIPFFLNVYLTARSAPRVTVNDPWGYGARSSGRRPARRLGTTSPRFPRIRSERPAFDLNHPEVGIPVGIGPAQGRAGRPHVRCSVRERSSK